MMRVINNKLYNFQSLLSISSKNISFIDKLISHSIERKTDKSKVSNMVFKSEIENKRGRKQLENHYEGEQI